MNKENMEKIKQLHQLLGKLKKVNIDIRFKTLAQEDCEKELNEKAKLEQQINEIETLIDNISDKLSDEYYNQKVAELKVKLQDELQRIKTETTFWLDESFLKSFEEQMQIRAYSNIIKNPDILNEKVKKVNSRNPEGNYTVIGYDSVRNNGDLLGYYYDDILLMCKGLLETNPKKYVSILFNNPDIEMIKPELINWFLKYNSSWGLIPSVGMPSYIKYLEDLPSYVLSYINFQTIDDFIKSSWQDKLDDGTIVNRFSAGFGLNAELTFAASIMKVFGQTKYVTKELLESTIALWSKRQDVYDVLLANPNLPTDVSEALSSFDYTKKCKKTVYYWLPRINEINFSDFSYYHELNDSLKNRKFNFKDKNNENLDWFLDMNDSENQGLRVSDYEKTAKMCAFHSVLCGSNKMTTQRLHDYINIKDIDRYFKAITGLAKYITKYQDEIHPYMKSYFMHILSGFVAASSRYGFVDKLKIFLENENNRNYSSYVKKAFKISLNALEEIKKSPDSVHIYTGGDCFFMNDYTIDDIEKLYIHEAIEKNNVGLNI